MLEQGARRNLRCQSELGGISKVEQVPVMGLVEPVVRLLQRLASGAWAAGLGWVCCSAGEAVSRTLPFRLCRLSHHKYRRCVRWGCSHHDTCYTWPKGSSQSPMRRATQTAPM